MPWAIAGVAPKHYLRIIAVKTLLGGGVPVADVGGVEPCQSGQPVGEKVKLSTLNKPTFWYDCEPHWLGHDRVRPEFASVLPTFL